MTNGKIKIIKRAEIETAKDRETAANQETARPRPFDTASIRNNWLSEARQSIEARRAADMAAFGLMA